MAKGWYFQLMGAELGPVSGAELKKKAEQGQITPETLVRSAPDGKWQTADRIRGLIDAPPPPPEPAAALKAKPAETPAVASPTVKSVATATASPPGAKPVSSPAAGNIYHFVDETAADAPSDLADSGEFDFFKFVGFEQAIGPNLFQVLQEHCRKNQRSLSDATKRALAEFLGRKDLIDGPAAAPTTPA
jgi:biotin carboxyl carrier protein